jgi:hypothetical protein
MREAEERRRLEAVQERMRRQQASNRASADRPKFSFKLG